MAMNIFIMILISLLISCLVMLVFGAVLLSEGKHLSEKEENKRLKIIYIVTVITFVTINSLFMFIANEDLKSDTEKYLATKQTIEESLQSDKLSGLERIELVKMASEQNAWLKETQYKVKQWYSFYYSKEILEIELIDIKE